jgi:hypothetical protein
MDGDAGKEMDGGWRVMQKRRWMVMDGDVGKEMDGVWMVMKISLKKS